MRSPTLRSVLILMLVLATFVVCACQPELSPEPTLIPSTATNPALTEPDPTLAEPTPEPTQAATEFTDGLGRAILLEGPAQRIVSLAPSNTEILFALGAGGQVIGRDELSDYPAEALQVTSVGNTYGDLNTEAIVNLEPDLVLLAQINNPEHVTLLEDLGLTVYYLANPMGFDALNENLRIVGQLTGHEQEAQTLAQDLTTRVDAVLDAVADAEPVRVYYEVDGTDPTAPWTVGQGTFQQVMFDLLKAENIAMDLEGWGQLGQEEIVSRDPEVMIFASGPWVPTTVETVQARVGWEGVTAVAEGRVHAIDTNWVDRPGPRMVDALEAMARIFHPERFE